MNPGQSDISQIKIGRHTYGIVGLKHALEALGETHAKLRDGRLPGTHLLCPLIDSSDFTVTLLSESLENILANLLMKRNQNRWRSRFWGQDALFVTVWKAR